MTRGLDAEDLFRLRLVDEPQLSPAGDLLAYTECGLESEGDRRVAEVVVVTVTTGETVWRSGARHFDAGPRWSPDGGELAFVSDREDGAQIWIAAPASATLRRLTRSALPVTSLDWSPDGSSIAFCAAGLEESWARDPAYTVDPPHRADPPDGADSLDRTGAALPAGWRAGEDGGWPVDGRRGLFRQRSEVLLVGRDGTAIGPLPPRRPGEERAQARRWCPRWSPDGARIGYLSDGAGGGPPSQIADVFVVEPGGSAAPARLTRSEGPIKTLCWSPDGETIAFIGHRQTERRDAIGHVLAVDVSTRELSDLTAGLDRSAGLPVRSDDWRGYGEPALAWSGATGRIYFEVSEGGRGPIAWVDRDAAYGYMFEGNHVCLAPSLAGTAGSGRGRGLLAFVVSDCSSPGEVHVTTEPGVAPEPVRAPAEDGPQTGPLPARLDLPRRLTSTNGWMAALADCPTRQVHAVGADGSRLEGWLTLPPSRGPDTTPASLPLVVSVHGGPHYAVGWRFSFETRRLAGRGFAVLSCNPRGSHGYGQAFASGTRGDWGGGDFDDIGRLVDATLAGGAVLDRERIAITGVSYGGYMAQWAITRTGRYRLAVSENGISSLLGQWGSGADRGLDWATETGPPPWEDPAPYIERSPLAHAAGVSTPLLLLHAELDANCPLLQSEQMFAALRFLGKDAELVVLEGEGHLVNLVGRPSRRLLRAAVIDEHLDRHLGASTATASASAAVAGPAAAATAPAATPPAGPVPAGRAAGSGQAAR